MGIANLFKKLEKLPSETKEVFLEFLNQFDEMNKRIKIGVTKGGVQRAQGCHSGFDKIYTAAGFPPLGGE